MVLNFYKSFENSGSYSDSYHFIIWNSKKNNYFLSMVRIVDFIDHFN